MHVEDRLTPNITAAFEVTPLWDQSCDYPLLFLNKPTTHIQAADGPNCTMLEVGFGGLDWDLPIPTATYYCPSSELNQSSDAQGKIIKFYYEKVS